MPSEQHQVAFKKAQKKRKWKLLLTYSWDWLITLGLLGVFLGLDQLDGFRRRFSLTDTNIQFPYAIKERVPDWLLFLVSLVAPFFILPVVNFLSIRSWWDLHNAELGLVLSIALTGSVTNILKVSTGRPRPDLIDRCQPEAGITNPPVYGLVDWTICTQTNPKIMKDGWRSFASAHASLSFAGLGFLSLYLAGKLHLFDERGHTTKAWIAIMPSLGALVIAITRSMDYRHHWQDIFVGIVLGSVFAYFSYRQYFPSLDHPLSHRPYGPRIPPPSLSASSSESSLPIDPAQPSGTVKRGEPGDSTQGPTVVVDATDLESGVTTEALETPPDQNPDDTIPRGRPSSLSRLWSQKSGKSPRRAERVSDVVERGDTLPPARGSNEHRYRRSAEK